MQIQKKKRMFPAKMIRLLFLTVLFCMMTGNQPAFAKTETILFRDGSGNYLQKRGTDWYACNKRGAAMKKGLKYLATPDGAAVSRGYYQVDTDGKVIRTRGVYYYKNKTVHGKTFHGYYATNTGGRFVTSEYGLAYLSGYRANGVTYDGYYYIGANGKLNVPAQCRYLKAKKIGKVSFEEGYYWFNSAGKLRTEPVLLKVNAVVHGRTFDGYYYFGGTNGRLYTKSGWVTLKEKSYYINKDGKKCTKGRILLGDLQKKLENTIQGYDGSWSVYVKDLTTGASININDRSYYAASIIKTYVMASIYDQIKAGKLTKTTDIRELLKEMITVSDNEACNDLIRDYLGSGSFINGTAAVNAYLSEYGYTGTECHHTLGTAGASHVTDGKGMNLASAKDAGVLLERIYSGTCVSPKYSKEMLNLLLGQTRRWKIPAGLPAGTKAANKTGEKDTYDHDMAIVYGPKTTYIICVFSNQASSSSYRIQNISRIVYEELNK